MHAYSPPPITAATATVQASAYSQRHVRHVRPRCTGHEAAGRHGSLTRPPEPPRCLACSTAAKTKTPPRATAHDGMQSGRAPAAGRHDVPGPGSGQHTYRPHAVASGERASRCQYHIRHPPFGSAAQGIGGGVCRALPRTCAERACRTGRGCQAPQQLQATLLRPPPAPPSMLSVILSIGQGAARPRLRMHDPAQPRGVGKDSQQIPRMMQSSSHWRPMTRR